MSDTTGKYRSMLDSLHKTAREVVMDEIQGDINRLLEYSQSIDTTDVAGTVVGIETIVCALKEMARKAY
jgi:hypothetical protein